MSDLNDIIYEETENSPKYDRIRTGKVRKMTYEKIFKEEAVRLSDEIGVKKAAEQLGIPYDTLEDWRYKRKSHGSQTYVGSGHRRISSDPKEQEIYEVRKENAELRRSNEILQEALGFFAKNRKK